MPRSSTVSPERAFGFVFAGLFAVVALLPLLRAAPPRGWALAVAAGFLAAGLVVPGALAPLRRLWLRVGDLLHRITTPVALAVLFFGVVTPTAIVMRILRKDPLRLRRDPAATTYWLERRPPGPEPDSLRDQF
jgi:hypothetical protein